MMTLLMTAMKSYEWHHDLSIMVMFFHIKYLLSLLHFILMLKNNVSIQSVHNTRNSTHGRR